MAGAPRFSMRTRPMNPPDDALAAANATRHRASPYSCAVRHLVVIASTPAADKGMIPLGSRKQVLERLANLNTHPDTPSGDVLYGPGIEFQLGPQQESITQMLLDVTDEDIAWLVIERIGRTLQWKFVDMNTGNELVFSPEHA